MASKKESNFVNMVLALVLVSVVAALALGSAYVLTKKPIALAQKRKQEAAIKAVLPAFNQVKGIKVPDADGADSLLFNVATKAGKLVGIAVKTYTDKGFGGRIEAMIGFLPDGTIYNTSILELKETPGLGTKLQKSKSDFPDQFKGENPKTFRLKVKKDGGDVDAITAATISSRAFCDAVQRAYDTFQKEKSQIK